MEAAATGLVVDVDGQKGKDKLKNGGEITIPAGPYSYTFQMDMLTTTNGYKPVLRPCGAERTSSSSWGNHSEGLHHSRFLFEYCTKSDAFATNAADKASLFCTIESWPPQQQTERIQLA